MKAIVLEQVASMDDISFPLRLIDVPVPRPGPNELRIKVSVCGVCHIELDEMEGRLTPSRLPIILGHEVVGRVETCGTFVSKFSVGDRVGVGRIQIRYFDRDDNRDLGEQLSATCGAHRVPLVLFLSEDNYVCDRYDRTLSKYRDIAEKQLGAACPTGIGGQLQSMLDAVVQEWLDEFERIQLMLRLSGRLRTLHND